MKKLALGLSILMMSGCASFKTQEDLAGLTENAINNAPTCKSKETCDSLMELAQVWVSKNTSMRIQSVTTAIISTYDDQHDQTEPSFHITKEPVGSGKYRLLLNAANGYKDGKLISDYERELNWRLKFNTDIKSMSQ